MTYARTERDYSEYSDLPRSDIVASGYEATCPRCETLCHLIAVPRYEEAVFCSGCQQPFQTTLPEHAYA